LKQHNTQKSLSVLTAIFQVNLGYLVFLEALDDARGGDNWSYKSCKAPVKSSPPTNQHPVFYRLDALPLAQPTVMFNNNSQSTEGKNTTFPGLAHPKLTWGSSNFVTDH